MTKAELQALGQKIKDGKATDAEKISFAQALKAEFKNISTILKGAKKTS